jgi:hypothetical protein
VAIYHLVYPHGREWLRWSPADEADLLAEEGWWCEWMDENGVSRRLLSRAPAQFVWQNMEGGKKKEKTMRQNVGARLKKMLVERMERSNDEN